MNVLITGVSGFLGSNITSYLLNQPEIKKVYGNFRNIKRISEEILDSKKFVPHNGTIESIPYSIIEDVTVVIHTAGSAANSSDLSNRVIADSLIQPTIDICDKLKNSINRPALYFFSSGAVYGPNCTIEGFKETDPLILNDPKDLYSASKIFIESILSDYAMCFPIVSLRLFSFIGRGYKSHFPYALASFLNSALKNEDIFINNPEGKRNYLDVYVLSQIIFELMLKRYNFQKNQLEVLNIGSNSILSFKELANAVVSTISSNSKIYVNDNIENKGNRNYYYPNLSKLNAFMEIPTLDIRESIYNSLHEFQ
jgi:nucleoside-diphosphate-sugar epimerase